MKTIRLDGFIGEEVTAKRVSEMLREAVGEDITIELNTFGGEVYDAFDIYKQIKDYPGSVTIKMGGIVASAGSYIAAHEDAHIVADSATAYMIHNPWTFVAGDFRDLAKEADNLRKLGGHFAQRLADMSGEDKEKIIDMMNEETWLYGQEIVDAGFAHELSGPAQKTGRDQAIASARKKFETLFHSAAARAKEKKSQEADPEPKAQEKSTVKETKVDRKEAINFLKADMSKEEIAEAFGIVAMSEEGKKILDALAEKKIADPVAKIASLSKTIEDNAEATRQAILTESFGKKEKANLVREYAASVTVGLSGEKLTEKISAIKEDDEVAKNLMAKQADFSDDVHTIGRTEDGNGTTDDSDVVYC